MRCFHLCITCTTSTGSHFFLKLLPSASDFRITIMLQALHEVKPVGLLTRCGAFSISYSFCEGV